MGAIVRFRTRSLLTMLARETDRYGWNTGIRLGELELDEHHVVPEPHGQVERRCPGQEVIHLEQKQSLL